MHRTKAKPKPEVVNPEEKYTLRLGYHYENQKKLDHMFFSDNSEVVLEASKGEVQISYKDQNGKDIKAKFQKEVISLGRKDCDIETDDSAVSKKQVEIFNENNNFYISCLSPTNATYFKLKVKTKYYLSLNMVINVGFEYFLVVKDISPAIINMAPKNGGDDPIYIRTFLMSEATNKEKEEFSRFLKNHNKEVSNIFFISISFLYNLNKLRNQMKNLFSRSTISLKKIERPMKIKGI